MSEKGKKKTEKSKIADKFTGKEITRKYIYIIYS